MTSVQEKYSGCLNSNTAQLTVKRVKTTTRPVAMSPITVFAQNRDVRCAAVRVGARRAAMLSPKSPRTAASPASAPARATMPASAGPTIGAYAIDDPVPAAGLLDEIGPVEPAEAGGPDTAAGLSALLELTCVWAEQSNGRRSAVGVHGDAAQAVAALTGTTGRRLSLPAEEALALMAWAGASGGAYGRRRGMARGRFEAWWCAAALAGLDSGPRKLNTVGTPISRRTTPACL